MKYPACASSSSHAGSARDAFDGLSSLPHVAEMLERHLEPAVDPVPAMRAVYGSWFAQFERMDRAWAGSIAARVFPRGPELLRYFEAAWGAYIGYTPAFTRVFELLRDAYAHAIELAPSGNEDEVLNLGEHLMRFRVAGRIGLAEDDLLARHWHAIDEPARARLLAHVGWVLGQTTEPLPADDVDRIIGIWAWIVDDAQARDAPAPLGAFAGWLAVMWLDGGWLLEQARAVLALGVALEPSFTVYRALPRLAGADAHAAMGVLRLILKTDPDGWALAGGETEVAEALTIALRAEEAETQALARQVSELLIARGFTSFRGLLEG